MRASAEEQISAFLANKPGVVADLCAAFTEQRINIRAVTVLDTVDIGTMRLVVDDVEAAKEALKVAGAAFVVVPVIAVPVRNKPGSFARAARTIANAGVNIEYVYGTAMPGADRTLVIFRVSDHQKALQLEFED